MLNLLSLLHVFKLNNLISAVSVRKTSCIMSRLLCASGCLPGRGYCLLCRIHCSGIQGEVDTRSIVCSFKRRLYATEERLSAALVQCDRCVTCKLKKELKKKQDSNPRSQKKLQDQDHGSTWARMPEKWIRIEAILGLFLPGYIPRPKGPG